jgi:hypothetical protein
VRRTIRIRQKEWTFLRPEGKGELLRSTSAWIVPWQRKTDDRRLRLQWDILKWKETWIWIRVLPEDRPKTEGMLQKRVVSASG